MKINWLDWGKEAFDIARRENKPVLLDIHGVWCHWCHVMDQTTYSDEDVIEIVNKNFVPIKVDTDRRPDINERYNQGGWPTTCFLTDTGKIITGATYVPANDMKILLSNVISHYNKIKNDNDIKDTHEIKLDNSNNLLDKSIINQVLKSIENNFDAENGGFGKGQKFPMEDAINLCLLSKDKKIISIAVKTLDEMIKLSDSVEGGFFRYSMTPNWLNPHYEKMLESNAKIIMNYLYGYIATGNEKYREVIEKTINYIINNLMDEEGGFYGSQDAGSEEEYYGKIMEERQKMEKPRIDNAIYTNLSAMMIYSLLKCYSSFGNTIYKEIAIKSINFLLKNCKNKGMYHYFDGKPNVENIASDQIWMIKCLIEAYQITGYSKYIKLAEELSEFLLSNFTDGNGFFDMYDDEPIGYLKIKNKSIFENSLAAENFLFLSYAIENDNYKKIAEKCLSLFSEEYKKYGIHASSYAISVEKFLNSVVLYIAGDKSFIEKNMLEILKMNNMRLVPVFLDKDSKYYKADNSFYVCSNNTCNKFKTLKDVKDKIDNF